MDNCKTEATASAEHVPGKRLYLAVKRAQDILLSALALVVLSPLLMMISLLIVLDDPHGGPIYSQIRCGKNGKEFQFYKFRTMCVDAEQRQSEMLCRNDMCGPAFKIINDPRITRFGMLLRKTSLDELPQLVNVLKGDMSLVGPRPPIPWEVEQYTPYQRQRLRVTPGITGLWQIQPRRNHLTFDEWLEFDLKYIQEQSWLLDWKLLFLTVKAVFRADGE